MMIVRLTTSEAADMVMGDKYAGWTYHGALALVEHLEELEEETGEPIEFDVVAIRCDYSEYASARAAALELSDWEYRPEEWGADYDEDEAEEHALQYLRDRTTVIVFNGGVVVQAF
jgi:hypothetical protein